MTAAGDLDHELRTESGVAVPPQSALTPQAVTPVTIARYLMGDRQAITDLFASRYLLILSGLLVLSAGFAREYDGEDLWHEPWHLAIPHAASLVTAWLLYCLLRLPSIRQKAGIGRFFHEFPRFLGLYWMTAPMAWLYAIPMEFWTTPGEATRANLWLLAIVSVWRVALITRVIRVVYDTTGIAGPLCTVLLFGDVVMLTAVSFVAVPVLQLMGGVRLTESESLLQGIVLVLRVVGFPALLPLLVAYLIVLPPTPVIAAAPVPQRIDPRWSAWAVAISAVLVWTIVLPVTQPPQQLRRQVEHQLNSGQISDALQLMSNHTRSDFPPHWSPPPHVALLDSQPPITDVIHVLMTQETPPWVREIFLDKFRRQLPDILSFYRRPSDAVLLPFLQTLERLPLADWEPNNNDGAATPAEVLGMIATEDDSDYSDQIRALAQRLVDTLPAPPSVSPTAADESEQGESAADGIPQTDPESGVDD